MSDIKSMFSKMTSQNGSGDNTEATQPEEAKSKSKEPKTIEKMYQKKSQLEHILLRPDTYIGSVEKTTENMWIYDEETKKMEHKEIEYVPGLYKIFDEILVNAADHKQRDSTMDCIKIEINAATNTISVYNNGKGIPVVMHKEENMFVPTMIFGHLLTSSNYDDNEEKVTGGRNGYGAKLCNIFSTKFIVETASRQYRKHFKQTWGSNMTKASEAKVKDFTGEEFTKITFCPDLEKFKMTELDDGIVGLMSRRAFDIAATAKGVRVFLNGTRVPVKSFKDYIDLYVKDKEDDMGNPLKIMHEQAGERWEVGVTISNKGFQQMSFVNSIATTKGGKHVDYISDMITKQLIEVLKKKNKGGVTIRPFQVKNHMWLFVNCLIVNPTFDSQTKENMTSQQKSFGSKCTLSEKFINAVIKSGIIEQVLSWAKFKAQDELKKKTSGRKQTKLKGVPKLEDANEAGGKNSLKCTLILTEGDSAKSLAVSGLGVIGRDYYGVFPLRGKLLNVREAKHKQILENAEINNLITILGLKYKMKYVNDEDMRTLRYGKVMIMTDQDQDGSHIKGLLINFIHHNWPELLKMNFIEEFITPIVKAIKKNEEHSFYSLPEFEEWRANTANHHTYHIKYYKGLGTSTSKEAKEYFTNMARHRIRFRYEGQTDDDHILLAFSKKHIEHRKEWLTNFMVESRRRKELGLAEKYLYQKDTKYITYSDFVNLELVLFSNADNIRSIPSLVDGLKPGQRKVTFTCLKRNDKREVKVAQLAGSVAEMSAYHHGEVSLCSTIVNLAQNFVGSNNINILEPKGQFGTRLAGGKDSASPRYIFTKMSPLTRLIFNPHDDAILKYEFDDNQKIEPVWYIPIIPMVLVNGADGIGTGWMTKIPNFNPRDIIACVRRLIAGEESKELMPWYKNFKGTIEDCGERRYVVNGEISQIGNDKLEITELPVQTWTQNYKENVMEVLLHGSEKVKPMINDYKEYNTDTTVKFVVTVTPEQLENLEKEGMHKVFKLQNVISLGSMCAFDELGCLKKFESPMTILQEFYTLRLKMYQKRKDYLEGMLGAEVTKLSNQARFILEKCSGQLTIENKKRKAMIDELISRGYEADPVKDWKQKCSGDGEEEEDQAEDDDGDVEKPQKEDSKKKTPADPEKAFQKLTDVKKFDYLLGMSMWMLTEERKNELLRQRDTKEHELNVLKKKTNYDLWLEDLDEFVEKLDEVEEKERKDEEGVKSKDAKKVVGRKKLNLQETMPSPIAKRVEPVITNDLKKRIQTAIKLKDKCKKGTKKENIASSEVDEFDVIVNKSKKTLKEKIGTPEDVESKVKGTKGGNLKKTILTFKKEGRGNGWSKMNRSSSDEENSFEETRNIPPVAGVRSSTSRRKAVKDINYDLSSESEDEPLYDNEAVKENSQSQPLAESISSNSEDEAPPRMETSEDMFDSLIGKKKDVSNNDKSSTKTADKRDESDSEVEANGNKRRSSVVDSSESDFGGKSKPKRTKLDNGAKKTEPKKQAFDSDLSSDERVTTTKSRKKKNVSDCDSDFGKKLVKPKAQKKKPAKKAKKGSDADEDEPLVGKKTNKKEPAKKPRGRAAPKSKKVTSDDDVELNSDEDFGGSMSNQKQKKNKFSDDDVAIDGAVSESGDYKPPTKTTSRTCRAAAPKKYVFSDDDD